MVAETMTTPMAPAVLWAQRKNCVFVTFDVSDLKNQDIKVETDKVVFDAEGADGKKYHVDLNLFGEIDPEQTKELKTGLHTEMVLMKKEEGPFWPRLLKEKGKAHFLKVNFAKWKDEDEDEDEAEDFGGMDMGGMGMGGMPGMGMSGMGGMMGGPGGMDMAQLQQMLAQMPGGGAGAGLDFDAEAEGPEGDDGEDGDDMPDLE